MWRKMYPEMYLVVCSARKKARGIPGSSLVVGGTDYSRPN